jgi:hypothetical protein
LKKILRLEKHLFIYSHYKIILSDEKKKKTKIFSLLRSKYSTSLVYKSAYLINFISNNDIQVNPKKSNFGEISSDLKFPRKMRIARTSLKKFMIFFNINEFYTIRRYKLFKVYDFFNWPVRIIGYTKLDKKSFLRYSLVK